MASKSTTKVHLVPWDPDSEEHIARLVQQRQQCGWDQDKVPIWRETQRQGLKCLFWITMPVDGSDTEGQPLDLSLLPKDELPLRDTAVSLRGTARDPTHQFFYPVGHISLDSENPGAAKADLDLPPEGLYWIKSFFVSRAIQSQGIGRAAMDIVESMAVAEPLCARTLGLDTVEKEDAINLEIWRSGKPPKLTNQEWYERRGYKALTTVQNLYHSPDDPEGTPDFKAIFMKKDIV